MLKSVLSICLCLLCSVALFSQEITVSGTVMDSVEAHPVEFASVSAFHVSDSSFVSHAYTDKNGTFRITANGQVYLNISQLGYKILTIPVKNASNQSVYRLDTVYLHVDAVMLNELVIESKAPDVQVKGDTIEYNAAAYLSDKNDLLQDLVKNLPGVELDMDGNLSVNGKKINKITVDGKDFFNNDIQLALKNLPANMVKKLQLFQEQTEEAKVSGIKSDDGQQVLNLELKEEYKQNMFGDASLGYGTEDRYSAHATFNTMRENDQLSIVGESNNLPVNSSMGGIGRGMDTNTELGANINKMSETFNLNGSVSYNDNTNLTEEESRVETIDVDYGNAIDLDSEKSESKNKIGTLNLGFNWKPDSLTTIYFRTNGNYSKSRDAGYSESLSYYTQNEENRTSGTHSNTSTGNRYNINGSLNIGRKLNAKGRNISINFSGSLGNGRTNGFYNSRTEYASGLPDKLHDQRLKSTNNNSSYSLSASYVEPVTKHENLFVSYTYRRTNNKYDNNKFRKADPSNPFSDYTVIDTLYVSRSTGNSASQQLSIGFQSFREKNELRASFNFSPLSSENTTIRQLDSVEYLAQKNTNWNTQLTYTRKFNKNKRFSINYNGNTRQPSAQQLSMDTTILSNTSKSYGNPDLKASFSNQLNLSYDESDYEKGSFFNIGGSFSYVFNEIASYTKRDSLFNTANSFKNLSGDWEANVLISYNRPLKKDKWTFSTFGSLYYRHDKGYANGEENISNNIGGYETITLYFKAKKIESHLIADYNYSLTKNSLQHLNNVNISAIRLSNNTVWELPYDFKIENSLSYSRNFGYDSGYKNSELMWDAELSKQFLKNKAGTLKLSCYDILKDRNNIIRYAGNASVSETHYNMIGNYFMLSFSYRFNSSE